MGHLATFLPERPPTSPGSGRRSPRHSGPLALLAAAAEVLLEADRVAKALEATKTPQDRPRAASSLRRGGDPWCLLDTHHRHLESRWHNFDSDAVTTAEAREADPQGRTPILPRSGSGLARRSSPAIAKAKHPIPGLLPSPGLRDGETKARRTEAGRLFLVDAMRFEMGIELAERFPKTLSRSQFAPLTALPSITTIGMAALMPGASASFSVVEQAGKLGAMIDGSFLPDLASRKKLAAARLPQMIDMTLDNLLGLSQAQLRNKVQSAQVVIIRSQEIDNAGENSTDRQARRIMNEVLGDLATAIQRLARVGIEDTRSKCRPWSSVRPGARRIDADGCSRRKDGRAAPPMLDWARRKHPSGMYPRSRFGAGLCIGSRVRVSDGLRRLPFRRRPRISSRRPFSSGARRSCAHGTHEGSRGVPAVRRSRCGIRPARCNHESNLQRRPRAGDKQMKLGATGMSVRPLLMSAGRQVGIVGVAVDAEGIGRPGAFGWSRTSRHHRLPAQRREYIDLTRGGSDPATDAELYDLRPISLYDLECGS